jgi:dTDP-glucose 4,6-dehydratase
MSNADKNNILVTGAAGFIGSYLCEQLLRDFPTSRVIGYDVLAYCASKENLSEAMTNPRFSFVRGDICNESNVRATLKQYEIRTIVHCAAESHVDNSFGNSLHFTEVNVRGTHILLECAKEMHKEGKLVRFLHVSTDEVYGTTIDGEVHDEESLLQPTNPYSASKAAAEMYVRAYHKSYGLPTLITRSNNIYGPRQHPEKVVPRFVQRVLRGKVPRVDGKPTNERTFLYVTDVARAISTVLAKGVIGDTYNIGSNNTIKITELARRVVEMAKDLYKIDIPQPFVPSNSDRPFNDERYHLDWKKITTLGWQPRVEFEQGLRAIFDWHNADHGLRQNHWNDCEWLPLVNNN